MSITSLAYYENLANVLDSEKQGSRAKAIRELSNEIKRLQFSLNHAKFGANLTFDSLQKLYIERAIEHYSSN